MNLVSLLLLPAIISMQDKSARYYVAGAALLVLMGAIAFSKRSSGSLADMSGDKETVAAH